MVVSLVKDGSSTVMLLMTLFTTESNKKSCPEKRLIITGAGLSLTPAARGVKPPAATCGCGSSSDNMEGPGPWCGLGGPKYYWLSGPGR